MNTRVIADNTHEPVNTCSINSKKVISINKQTYPNSSNVN